MFIVFEGMDGSGKSTLIKGFYEWLLFENYKTVLTKEPGGTALGVEIRGLLKNYMINYFKEAISPLSQFLMYASDRSNHIDYVIKPNLEKNNIVLCDRYIFSSLVYQSYVQGISKEFINMVHNYIIPNNIIPDIVFYINADFETCYERISSKKEKELFDLAKKDMLKKIHTGYEDIMEESKNIYNIIYIDTTKDSCEESLKIIIEEFNKRKKING
jgi:dTMP kinase